MGYKTARRTAHATTASPGVWILTGIFTFVGLLNLLPFLASLAGAAGFLTGGDETVIDQLNNFMGVGPLAGLPDATVAGTLTTIGLVFLALAILNFAAAWGIWSLRRWAWGLGVVLAIIGLLFVPVGTVLGVVTLVYLAMSRTAFMGREVVEERVERPRAT